MFERVKFKFSNISILECLQYFKYRTVQIFPKREAVTEASVTMFVTVGEQRKVEECDKAKAMALCSNSIGF